MPAPTLDDLIARVEAGEAGRKIEMAIYFEIACVPNTGQIHPALGKPAPADRYPFLLPDFCPVDGTLAPGYLTSLDAIERLREELLPGWLVAVTPILPTFDGVRLFAAVVAQGDDPDQNAASGAPTECAARLAAILRAWEAQQ